VFEPGYSTLLFLPLAHVFGKVIEVACVEGGIVIGHWGDIPTMAQMLPQFAPDFILSVPRVFEKIYNTAKGTAAAKGNVGLKVFEFAERTAIEYSKALDTPAGPNAGLRAKHSIATRLVYSKMHEKTGGNVKYAISGGGPLGERLGHFYRGAGINILEGYGLTETAAAITVNLPEHQKIGSVGPPLPGCSVRIADDGEILLKGPVVYNGYWHNEEATAEAIEPDGWFHSGDIGKLDQDGFLTITGRKKEILVTAAGKNVAPAVLEDRINADPIVGISMVVGDGKPFIACLISIDMENWAAWKQNNGKPESASVADLKDDPDLRAQIQGAIDNANKAVSKAESVRKFEILPFELNEENGDLTPTLKLKRTVVMEKYGDLVESLYS
jgi:long-chain acyl-CoA synthetase